MMRPSWLNWILLILMLLAAALIAACSAGAYYQPGATQAARIIAGEPTTPGGAGSRTGGLARRAVIPGGEQEIWIVARDHAVETNVAATTSAQKGMPLPGSPTLAARNPTGDLTPLGLKQTSVHAAIQGYLASVNISQQFANSATHPIEAVYVLPLPENAGVDEFVMTIGERHIRGIIRERTEAEQLYKDALAQGFVASLMTQERPNLFTQNIANIEPGREIDIDVRYLHTLSYAEGWFEWIFPMVSGPRVNEGLVERSGRDITLAVDLDAGTLIDEISSTNHAVQLQRTTDHTAKISLVPADRLPNRDFVLRWKAAAKSAATAMFVEKQDRGGYFSLMLLPPDNLKSIPRRDLEIVFVLDASESMRGRALEQATAAVNAALAKLRPTDAFQLVQFDSAVHTLAAAPVSANPDNITTARQFLAHLPAAGSKDLLKGIRSALDFQHDPHRSRAVAFFSDGYIGSEVEILRALHNELENTRVFTFGFGNAPNRYLLDAMAAVGNGAAEYLSSTAQSEPVIDAFLERASHPALANLQLDFGTTHVTDVYPHRIPDLLIDRPIILTGRFTGEMPGDFSLRGELGGADVRIPLHPTPVQHAGIGTLWARTKIADLEYSAVVDSRDVRDDVKRTALEHGIISAFTDFIAVDATGNH